MKYLSGFYNTHSSETEEGLLPSRQNSPQVCPQNLFAEQLSGTAFTKNRKDNLRTWLYRDLPSVKSSAYILDKDLSQRFSTTNAEHEPNQMRWLPLDSPSEDQNFVAGLCPLLVNPVCMIGLYAANSDMQNQAFSSADGEWLLVPQQGKLKVKTEMGELEVSSGEILVIPRGIVFRIDAEKNSRGYFIENQGSRFELPNLGPIGANGLANERHFLAPTASAEQASPYTVYHKYQGQIYSYQLEHSPFNVRAWWGNYYPYKYDLSLFNTINTVSFDHPDPSIFTVLTSPSLNPGVANIDFVIFPERWMVAENTFRPPYYHRNIMSEYMGLIYGEYDAKAEGFQPGGGSLHNQMSPHGPDAATFEKASQSELKPQRYEKTLAFMFESCHAYQIMPYGKAKLTVDHKYRDCWQTF